MSGSTAAAGAVAQALQQAFHLQQQGRLAEAERIYCTVLERDRKTAIGDWDGVVARVRAALADFAGAQATGMASKASETRGSAEVNGTVR